MAKCPKCHKKIDHLHYYAYELQKADFYIVNGAYEYSGWDSLAEVKGEPDYECPECTAVLFHDQEEAIAFLKGEKLLLSLTEFKNKLLATLHESHEAQQLTDSDLKQLHVDYYKSGLTFNKWLKQYLEE
jgi:hypothetical protein